MLFKSLLYSSIISFLFAWSHCLAHSETQVTRFVDAVKGKDQGDCKSRARPCQSIIYATSLAIKGDAIKVSKGTYATNDQALFVILSNLVQISGGYDAIDLFNTQMPKKNPTTLTGAPFQYRSSFAEKGFRIIQDKKKSQAGENFAKTYTKFLSKVQTSEGSSECINGKAGDYSCANINLLARVALPDLSGEATAVNDIWGFVNLNNDNEFALVGTNNGTAIVNVTTASSPELVAFIDGPDSSWRDIKVYQTKNADQNGYRSFAYVTNETGSGMQIIELTALPQQATLIGTLTDFSTAHNLYISNINYANGVAIEGTQAFLYIAGANKDSGVYRAYSLANPASPSLVSTPQNSGYMHDGSSFFINDSRKNVCNNPEACEIFIDFNESSVELWDVSVKSNTRLLSSTAYPGSQYTHSGWPSVDGNTLFIQDELDEQSLGTRTTLHLMNITDPINPVNLSPWVGTSEAIDHNGFVKADRYYMSSYRRGLLILNIAQTDNIKTVGLFDTYPVPAPNTATFDGAWGTFPFLPSNNLLVSDIQYGLFILESEAEVDPIAGQISFEKATYIGNANTTVTIPVIPAAPFDRETTISYQTHDDTAKSGEQYEAQTGTLTWQPGDASSKTVTINLLAGATDITELTLQLNDTIPSQAGSLHQTKIAIDKVVAATVQTTANSGTAEDTGGGSLNYSLLLLLSLSHVLRYRAQRPTVAAILSSTLPFRSS